MPLKKLFLLSLKTIVIGVLFYYLIQNGCVSWMTTQQAFTRWSLTLPALAILLSLNLLGMYRWHLLLRAQGIHLAAQKNIHLSLIGAFFNIALPGAVTGDIMKAITLTKLHPSHKNHHPGISSILLDRILGLSALCFIARFALFFQNTTLLPKMIFIFLDLAALGMILFFAYLFSMHSDPVLKCLHALERRWNFFKIFKDLYSSIKVYQNHPLALAQAFLISIIIHLLFIGACFQFAQALDTPLPFASIMIIIPLALLVTAIPIAPAGIGTGNLAFFYFFHLLGSNKGGDLFNFIIIANTLTGLLGGILYLKRGSIFAKPPSDESSFKRLSKDHTSSH